LRERNRSDGERGRECEKNVVIDRMKQREGDRDRRINRENERDRYVDRENVKHK
jgi:hypothetical protein